MEDFEYRGIDLFVCRMVYASSYLKVANSGIVIYLLPGTHRDVYVKKPSN